MNQGDKYDLLAYLYIKLVADNQKLVPHHTFHPHRGILHSNPLKPVKVSEIKVKIK